MKIIVLIKQVPDMGKVKFDSDKGVIDRKSAGAEINPFDLNALETALQIKEKIGATVITISMGPTSAENGLRETIARGGDEAILINDRSFGGADTKATSRTLSAAIKKVGKYDLIIAGEKTVDGDTGQVGAQVAEYLDIPHISYVNAIEEIEADRLQGVCDIWGGKYLKEMLLPGLITVTKNINTPRLPSFKGKMAARKMEIRKLNLEDLDEFISINDVGIKGSSTWVNKIQVPAPITRKGKNIRQDNEAAVKEIITLLRESKIMEV